MSYVQTRIDPLYSVRYGALGQILDTDSGPLRKHARRSKPPDITMPPAFREQLERRLTRPRPGRPRTHPGRRPIRAVRYRKRPGGGLGADIVMGREVLPLFRGVLEEALRKKRVVSTGPELMLPTEAELPVVPLVRIEPDIVMGREALPYFKRVLKDIVQRQRIDLIEPGVILPTEAELPVVPTVTAKPTTFPGFLETALKLVREQAIAVELPGFEVDNGMMVVPPRKPEIKSKTRSVVVSVPVDKADAKLAFELAEAQKYGFTHAAWMAMSWPARGEIREAYADGYKPVTPGGTPIDAATVKVVAGPDPLRQDVHYTGAGDYPGGLEIANPDPNVPLKRTTAGLTFDDILRIDPIRIQTAEEAAGLVPVSIQKYATYGLMAVGAWILYDSLIKSKRPKRRRATSRPRRRVRR